MAIIKRADKGAALTYNEMDANFDAVAPRDSATGAIEIPTGTTGQQPASPVVGQLRFNTQLNLFEGYFETLGWSALAASGVSGEVNQNAWAEIVVAGQSNVVADQKSDVLTLVAGTDISITTNPTADSITINSTYTPPSNVSAFTNDSGYLTSETTTTLTADSVNQKLVYTDETGTANDVSLSWAVDDTNLARITSGTVDGGTGVATFTRDDATNFTVDFSALFDDTNLTRITSGSFDSGTGDLTLTRSDATTAATISLDGRYLTSYTETNDLTSAVTWANIPNANVPQSAVTQHQAALSITESQISDLQSYLTSETNDLTASVTWANIPDANVPQSAVTQHQAALSITESQISDLDHYTNSDVDTHLSTITATTGQVLSWNGTGYSWVAQTAAYSNSNVDTHLNTSTATTGEVLSWTGTDYDWVAQSGGGGLANVVEDTTPQLGGTLDLNGNEIQNNGNIILHPTSGSGYVGVNSTTATGGKLVLNADQTGTPSSSSTNWSYIEVERGNSTNVNIRWNEGTDIWEFTNNGSTYSPLGGSYANSDVDTHLNTSSASTNQILSWNGSDYAWVADQTGSSGIANVVEDTTPQLGGNLDVNGNSIISTGNIILDSQSTVGYVGINKATGHAGMLLLAADATGTPSSASNNWAYIGVERGTSPNVYIRYNESTDQWQFTNNGSTYYDFVIADTDTGILSVIEDTTPQLGGNLDVNGNKITSIGTYGTVPIEVNINSVATELVKFGYDPVNPTTPVAARYGTTFTDKVWIDANSAQQFDLYDVVTDTADITSDAGIYMNFIATDGISAYQTRSTIWHQNNMLRITSHDKDDVSPQSNYLQLTLKPTMIGTSGFTISSVVNSVVTNYDVVTDQNLENKVFYSIFQPTESSNTLRHANYTTTERNALIVGAGTVIWNTTDTKLQVYNGSSWENLH